MEIGTLQHHVCCSVVCTATLAAEYTGDTHGLLGIADAQVVQSKRVLLAVEGDKLGALGLGAHYNLMTLHLVGIKAVHGLTVSHHYIIGDIHDVVDRTQTDDLQFVLQPFWTLLHLASRHAHTGITLAGLGVLNSHLHGQVVIIHHKTTTVGAMQTCLLAICHEPCIEVAGHSPMRECIRAVGGDVNLDEPVALKVVVFSGRLPHLGVLRQHNDSGMVGANTYLVLCAYHSAAFHATQFRLLYNKLLVAVVEHAAQVGNNHLLSGSHVGGAAYNLRWSFTSEVNSGYMQMVTVGMHFACEHLAHIQSLEATLHGLHLFQCVNFESCGCQCITHLLRRKVEINVFFQPFVGYIHLSIMLLALKLRAKLLFFQQLRKFLNDFLYCLDKKG